MDAEPIGDQDAVRSKCNVFIEGSPGLVVRGGDS